MSLELDEDDFSWNCNQNGHDYFKLNRGLKLDEVKQLIQLTKQNKEKVT